MRRRRRPLALGLALRLVLTAATSLGPFGLAGVAGAAGVARAASPRTIVSLEFDHATSDELQGTAIAAAHGMPVTVFAISGRIGADGYMTADQLRGLQRAGDEVGGHTTDHQDLATLSPAAQRTVICGDRAALGADGLDVTDFAYPYGHFGTATPGIARGCGYESARGTGGLASPDGCYGPCPVAESIPPANPFDTRTVDSVLATTPPAAIERYVTRAEQAGGGWVQIVFHHVCDRCDPYAVAPATLAGFLDWLAPRSATGTVVRTVRQVIETPFSPAAVRILRPGARPLRMLAGRRCPATPVTARCATVPGRARPTVVAVRRGGLIWLATSASPASVRLLAPGARPVAARRAPRRGLWTLRVGTARRGAATIAVDFPLGAAYYPVRLTPRGAGVTPPSAPPPSA
jgi:peptidoglycan/xylan/chitin deacetylase (PgdA/CDA1 family)